MPRPGPSAYPSLSLHYPLCRSRHRYVYAGPVQGYAQVALAHVCKIHGKMATVVLGKNRDGSTHRFTQKAEELGANVIFLDDSRLKNVQAEAQSCNHP